LEEWFVDGYGKVLVATVITDSKEVDDFRLGVLLLEDGSFELLLFEFRWLIMVIPFSLP
jgi:hypothetical protein